MSDRYREIMRRVNDRYLTIPGDRWAATKDAFFAADLKRVRELLAATDSAMEAEGIAETTRDRIIFRLIYGEPPDGIIAPDWREAATRAVDSDLEKLRIMNDVTLMPPDWVT